MSTLSSVSDVITIDASQYFLLIEEESDCYKLILLSLIESSNYSAELSKNVLINLCESNGITDVIEDILLMRFNSSEVVCNIDTTKLVITWKIKLRLNMMKRLLSLPISEYSIKAHQITQYLANTVTSSKIALSVLQEENTKLKSDNFTLTSLADTAVKAREEVQTDLIDKFVLLLNEKKKRIEALSVGINMSPPESTYNTQNKTNIEFESDHTSDSEAVYDDETDYDTDGSNYGRTEMIQKPPDNFDDMELCSSPYKLKKTVTCKRKMSMSEENVCSSKFSQKDNEEFVGDKSNITSI